MRKKIILLSLFFVLMFAFVKAITISPSEILINVSAGDYKFFDVEIISEKEMNLRIYTNSNYCLINDSRSITLKVYPGTNIIKVKVIVPANESVGEKQYCKIFYEKISVSGGGGGGIVSTNYTQTSNETNISQPSVPSPEPSPLPTPSPEPPTPTPEEENITIKEEGKERGIWPIAIAILIIFLVAIGYLLYKIFKKEE